MGRSDDRSRPRIAGDGERDDRAGWIDCRGSCHRRPRVRGLQRHAPGWTRTVRRVSFPVHPPAGTKFPRGTAEMALSPDGSRLVFVALAADGTRKLWVRRFDSVESRAIEGSEDAAHPFWSPDGRSIAFFAQGKLRRIAEGGRTAARHLRCAARRTRRHLEPGWHHPVRRFRAAAGARGGNGRSAGTGDGSRCLADAPHARLAGVPSRRPPLSLPRAEQGSRTDGDLSGHPRFERHAPGARRRVAHRFRRRASAVAQQGVADCPALRRGRRDGRRRLDHHRRTHRLRHAAPIGRSLFGPPAARSRIEARVPTAA